MREYRYGIRYVRSSLGIQYCSDRRVGRNIVRVSEGPQRDVGPPLEMDLVRTTVINHRGGVWISILRARA